MKAKQYIIFTILCISMFMTSCEKWLDVDPKSQVKQEDLFDSEVGFREALFGVYTYMSENSLYGEYLSMSFLDVLAQTFTINKQEQMFYYESIYDYKEQGVQKRIDSIWSNMYFCIANCNNILDQIDGKEGLFMNNNYDITKAEAKALRAYLHFDILRMFAPSVASGADKPAIPYVDKISKTPFPQLTVNQTIDRIITELIEARNLLKDVDPIGPAFDEYDESDYYLIGDYSVDGGFLLHRRSRMNYYSITGLLARVYLYKGEKSEALKYAKEVIDSDRFKFVTEEKLTGGYKDYIFSDELLFGLYNQDLKKKSDRVFKSNGLFFGEERKDVYFETKEYGSIDYRLRYQFDYAENSAIQVVAKYSYNKDSYNYRARYIPGIRLSEMYYIAAECSEDLSYINTVRLNRGLFELSEGADFENELYKEYRKEFIAEGQMFYYLKRKNIVDIEYTAMDGTDKVYVFPIPDNEIEFGNIK